MANDDVVWLIRAAGALHFVQVPGMVVTLWRLRLGEQLAGLPPLLRQMMLVMSGGIVLCVLGTGACVALGAEDVASTRLGWLLCCFGALFWGYRSAIQLALYARSFPRNASALHHALSVLFPVKTVAYLLCLVLLPNPWREPDASQSVLLVNNKPLILLDNIGHRSFVQAALRH
jgi:hypothetical protein